MSREGFQRGDLDTGLMDDPKVRALARRLRSTQATGAAVALYVAVIAASWREGRRLTLTEALPAWWLDEAVEMADALTDVGLLDRDQQIPDHAWESWFGPARDRVADFRARASRGGSVRAEREREARASAGSSVGLTVGLSAGLTPSVRPTNQPSIRAQENDALKRVGNGRPNGHGPSRITDSDIRDGLALVGVKIP
jgi:hypothetical protein